MHLTSASFPAASVVPDDAARGAGVGVFQAVFENSPEAIALSRAADGLLVQVNQEWLVMTGYSREEAIGRSAVALGQWLDPEDREQVLGRLQVGGRVTDIDVTLLMKNRVPRVVRFNASMFEEAGERYLLVYLRDVTADLMASEALKAGEQALTQAHAMMRRQVEMHELAESVARVGHWVSYPNDERVQVSRSLALMAGLGDVRYTTREALWRHVHPDDLPRLHEARARMDGAEVEFRWLTQAGRVLRARSRMLRQVADGCVVADYGAVQEFTEECEARDALQTQLEFIQTITSRAPGMVYQLRMWPDGRFTLPFVSDGAEDVFGVTPAQVAADANSLMARVHPDDAQRVLQTSYECRDALQVWHNEFRVVWESGEVRWLLGNAVPQALPGGSVLFTGAITDITQQKLAMIELQLSEERFRGLSKLSSDWYWEQDEQYRFVRFDGLPVHDSYLVPEVMVGRRPWEVLPSGLSAAQWKVHKDQLEARQTFHDLELPQVRPDGSVIWMSINGEPIYDAQGQYRGYRGTARDISGRKAAEEEIERLAFFDALTALPNRRLLLDRLQHALGASVRSGHHGALLFIDLDNFKILNDTMGHQMGDLLLQLVAKRLLDCVRSVDTVARLGGDEFVVMLEELDADPSAAAAQAEVVAKKILSALNKTFVLHKHNMHSSPSIGVTLFFQHANSIEELLKRADLAMYQAKGAGRNTLRFFDPQMQLAASERAEMESDLRQALQDEQFVLYYQPVVDQAGRMTGVEALLRWLHPVRGMVPPVSFIPVAEQTGLIFPLGQWVLEAACAQLVAWSHSPETRQLSIAVNVSARQFRHPDFSAHILDSLRNSGANPYRLKLELTESVLVTDFEEAVLKMGELRSIGVSFSLDDFGTGYSSLSYLKRLPLDQLKIDQSFVRDVLTDPNDAAIARTILSLAKSLDLGVVAEGVETVEQHQFLLREGCRSFQGYFYGRPVPVSELPLR
nr:EAL domain-containing protein [uncultured Rhodoferax sp.]